MDNINNSYKQIFEDDDELDKYIQKVKPIKEFQIYLKESKETNKQQENLLAELKESDKTLLGFMDRKLEPDDEMEESFFDFERLLELKNETTLNLMNLIKTHKDFIDGSPEFSKFVKSKLVEFSKLDIKFSYDDF